MDPNAALGSPDTLVVLLLFFVGVFAGSAALQLMSRLLNVPAIVPILVGIAHLVFGTARYFLQGPVATDGIVYDAQSVDVGSSFGLQAPFWFSRALDPGKEGFPYVIGLLYSFLGRMPFVAIVINSFAAGLTALLILASAKLLSRNVHTKFVLFYMLVSPTVLTLGPSYMREALSWLGVVAVVYAYLLFGIRKLPFQSAAVALCAIILLYGVRTSLALLCIVAAVGATVLRFGVKHFGYKMMVGVTIAGAAAFVVFGQPLLTLLGYAPEQISLTRNYLRAEATTGYSPFIPGLGSLGLPAELLATAPNVFFGPFPWELTPAPVWLWVMAGVAFWWAALWISFKRLRNGSQLFHVLWILSFAVLMVLALGLTMTNYGIAARIRTIPTLVLVIIMSARFPRTGEVSETQVSATRKSELAGLIPVETPCVSNCRPAPGMLSQSVGEYEKDIGSSQ